MKPQPHQLPELTVCREQPPIVQPEQQLFVSEHHDLLPPPWVGKQELAMLLGKLAVPGASDKVTAIARSMAGRVELDEETGCWLLPTYLDEKNRARYGLIHGRDLGAVNLAHRLTVRHLTTTSLRLSRAVYMDHLCRNKPCCNPRHLEPVSAAENNRRTRYAKWIERNGTHRLPGLELPPAGITLGKAQSDFPEELEKWPWVKLPNSTE